MLEKLCVKLLKKTAFDYIIPLPVNPPFHRLQNCHSTDTKTVVPQTAAPLDSEGNVSKDESAWIEVAKETISCNKPKTLEFYVPDSIAQADYKIVIRTRYCSGEKQLKSVLSTVSKTVNVAP